MSEITGRAKGGKAAAEKMTAEERKAKSVAMVEAKKRKMSLPKASHTGSLNIGDSSIPCYVLDDGVRVLSQSGFLSSIGRAQKAKAGTGAAAHLEGDGLPTFLAASNLKPLITNDIVEATRPIQFITPTGSVSYGYRAESLPKVCNVYLKARDNNTILGGQRHIADKADILVRGLAEVGIVALVDEATGYQDIRKKDALAKILEKFVAKELQAWVKTFPIEYYKELCRLYGVPFPPERNNQFPQFFGHVTNNAIYSRIAPELLPELKKAATKQEKKAKLHQLLTVEVGHPKLREHLASIVTILKLSQNKEQFFDMVDRIHPRFNDNYLLDLSV